MKKLTTTVASARVLLALAWDRIVSFIEAVRTVKDATDKALAQIDKGVRALEAAEKKAEAEVEAAKAEVDRVINAFDEAYTNASSKRSAARVKQNRAAALKAKYTA